MAGVQLELSRASCQLLGGHSCLSSEAGLGLAVTGTSCPDFLMSKANLRPGHVLVLTKAVGTGILLRGAMLGEADGKCLQEAWDSMLMPNRLASEIFVKHGVRACTDISGFGLLGHAAEMAEASMVRTDQMV
jgi:selenide, water dikinase